jgi:hypothetical protein
MSGERGLDFEREIALLRSEREAAIADLDFEKAKLLETHIQALKSASEEKCLISEQAMMAKTEFTREKRKVVQEGMRVASAVKRACLNCETNYQRELTIVCENQGRELREVASALAKELELSASKTWPEVTALQREARANASESKYSVAESIAEECEKLRERQLEEERLGLHKEFSQKQAKIAAKHKKRKLSLEDHRALAIAEIKIDFEKKVGMLRRRLEVVSAKCGMKIGEREINEALKYCQISDGFWKGDFGITSPQRMSESVAEEEDNHEVKRDPTSVT